MDTIVMPITGKKVKISLSDFPKIMCWEDANNACKSLGKGWRLPTKDELKEIYNSKDEIGGFQHKYYWSTSEYAIDKYKYGKAWIQNFKHGYQFGYDFANYGFHKLKVRLVKDVTFVN